MNWTYYLSTYLLIGLVFMGILDLFHNYIEKNKPDMVSHEGYTNLDRIIIILGWPLFIFSLISTIITNKYK
jgi:hypothetical protein